MLVLEGIQRRHQEWLSACLSHWLRMRSRKGWMLKVSALHQQLQTLHQGQHATAGIAAGLQKGRILRLLQLRRKLRKSQRIKWRRNNDRKAVCGAALEGV